MHGAHPPDGADPLRISVSSTVRCRRGNGRGRSGRTCFLTSCGCSNAADGYAERTFWATIQVAGRQSRRSPLGSVRRSLAIEPVPTTGRTDSRWPAAWTPVPTPDDAVVILRDPVAGEDSISYSIEVLDGVVPAESGAVSLFIDPFGRPLSPVSVAGIHRRERRRMRRRF